MTTGAKAAVIAGAVVVIAFAAGVVSREEPAAEGGQAISGDVLLSYPAGWQPVAAPAPISGLRLTDPIMLAPRSEARGTGLVAGRLANATGPTPLPPRFLDTLERSPQSDVVLLGGLEAYRYPRLRQRGRTGALTLYVVPGLTSTAAIACMAPEATPTGFAADCERVAATVLRIDGATSTVLRPDRSYARRIDAAIGRLSRTRARERANLRRRDTSVGQTAVATRLARAYRRAAARTGRAKAPLAALSVNDAIATALRRTARAYADLAAAANRNRRPAYLRARRNVQRAELEVKRALGALETLGYRARAAVSAQR